MNIVVTGSRDATDRDFVFDRLDDLDRKFGPITRVAHGSASGVDSMARAWAFARNREQQPYPADWERHKRAAGPIRNGTMLKSERPAMVVAFEGGDGTANCVDQARKMGIKVVEVASGPCDVILKRARAD